MLPTLKIFIKPSCGTTYFYPDCALSHAIVGVSGKKCITWDKITLLRNAGFAVDIREPDGEMRNYPPLLPANPY